LNCLGRRPVDRDPQRVKLHRRIVGTTADHAVVGGVAVGFIHNHFPLVQIAQGGVGQIEKPIGSPGQAGRQGVAILVRNLIVDQLAEIQCHLLVGASVCSTWYWPLP
jgi:hypothetical protein